MKIEQMMADRGSDIIDDFIRVEGIDSFKEKVTEFLENNEAGLITTLVSFALFTKMAQYRDLDA